MSSLGKLVAAVALDAAEFIQGADKAKVSAAQLATDVDKQLRGIENSVKGALGGIAAGLAAGLGISAMKSAFDAYAEGAAKLGDLAAKAGTTVQIMGGLAPIAKLSGVAIDDVALGMEKLAKSANLAQVQTSSQAQAFASLGISTRDTNGQVKDTGTLIVEVADKLGKYQDGTAKTAYAQELLGKSGANLIPFMKELAELGLQNSTITAKQAAMAKDYEQNIVRLGVAKSALGKIISSEVLPVADAMVKTFIEMATRTGGVKDQAQALAADGSIRQFAMMGVQLFGLVINAGDGVKRLFQGVGEFIGFLAAQATNTIGSLATAVKLFIEGQYSKAWQELKDMSQRDGEIVAMHTENAVEIFGKPLAGDVFVSSVEANLARVDAIVVKTGQGVLGLPPKIKEVSAAGEALIASLEKELIKLQAMNGESTKYQQVLVDIAKLKKEGKTVDEDRAKLLAAEIDQTIRNRVENEAYLKVLSEIEDFEQKKVDRVRQIIESEEDTIERMRVENSVIGQSVAVQKQANIELERKIALRGIDNPQMLEAINRTYDLKAATAAYGDQLRTNSSILADYASRFGNFISGLLTSTKSTAQAVRDEVKQMVADIAGYLSQRLVLQIVASVAGGSSALGSAANTALGSSGNSVTGLALSAVNQWGGSLIGASSLTGGISSAVFGNAALTAGGDFVGTGLAGLAGNAALAAGATDAFAASVAAAVPVIGWIVAIGAVLYAAFGSKGGAPKSGGSFNGSFDASGTFLGDSGPRMFTPSGSDAQMATVGKGIASGYFAQLQSLGGTTRGSTSFGIGFDTDPGGSAPNRISSSVMVGGRSVFSTTNRDIGRDSANIAPEMQLEASRMILAALQQSDLPKAISTMLNTVTASTATQDQITAVFAGAQALKSLFDIVKRDPLKDLATSVATSGDRLNAAMAANAAAVRSVMSAYDGSAAAAVKLQAATVNYYNAQMALITQIQDLRTSIGDLFGATIRNFKLAGLDKQGQYNFYQQEADALQSQALASSDPETIRKLADKINADMQAAFNLLSPEDQAGAAGQAFIARGQATADALDARLEKLQKDAVDATKNTLAAIKKIIDDNAIAQQAAANAQQGAANTQLQAAQTPLTVNFRTDGGGQQTGSIG